MFNQDLDRQEPHAEVTLSNTALLVMFFSLVVICVIFFSLGYSIGRHNAYSAAVPAVTKGPPPRRPLPPVSTPAASAAAPAHVPAQAPTPPPVAKATPPPAPAPVPPPKPKPVERPSSSEASVSTPATKMPATGKQWTVQLAALSTQEDARALASALRKKGFAAEVRAAGAQYRVVTGPYTSQADAAANRDKLVDDGYMAVVK